MFSFCLRERFLTPSEGGKRHLRRCCLGRIPSACCRRTSSKPPGTFLIDRPLHLSSHLSSKPVDLTSGAIKRPLAFARKHRSFRPWFGYAGCTLAPTVLSTAPNDGSASPSLLLVTTAVLGLPIALWLYKCLMMIVFQRKIIYMNYVPPGARTEELLPDNPCLKVLHCDQISITSDHGVILRGLLVRRTRSKPASEAESVVIMYLQGNAGNPIHRLPVFQTLLRQKGLDDIAILAVAPRSYWLSSSQKPTEAGLLSDYRSVLEYAKSRFPIASIVLYGHSLGGSIAIRLLSELPLDQADSIKGLIVENAFSSIPDMVRALYSSRYNPYHYLGSLAWDKWDAVEALHRNQDTALGKVKLCVMSSGGDELVPVEMGEKIYRAATHDGKCRGVERVIIERALHDDAWKRAQWGKTMASFLHEMRRKP